MAERNIDIKIRARDEATGVFDRIKSGLAGLKRTTGGRSDLKEVLDLARGAGAVVGLKIAADMMARLAQGAGQFALDLTSGLKESRELVGDLAKSIPFVGQGFEIGEGIGNLVAAIGRANGASAEFVKKWQSGKSAVEETREALQHLANVKGAFAPGRQLEDDLTGRLFGARLKGKDLADLQLRRKQAADAEAVKALRDRADLDPDLKDFERKGLRETADRLERQAQRTHLEEKKKLDADYSKSVSEQLQESVHRRLAEESDYQSTDLRAHGQFLAAKLEESKRAFDDEKFQIIKRQREIAEADPSRAKDAQQQAVAELGTASKLKGRRDADARAEDELRQMRRESDLAGVSAAARIDSMRAEASLGSATKEIELERLEIAEKFRQKREEINERIKEDKELTKAQRDELRGILNGLDAQEEKEKRIAAIKRATNIGLAETQTGTGITGVASRFRTSIANLRGNLLAPAAAAAGGLASAATTVFGGAPGTGAGAGQGTRAVADNSKATQDNTDAIKLLAKFFQRMLNEKPAALAGIFGNSNG